MLSVFGWHLLVVAAIVLGLPARWLWRAFRPVQRAELEAFAAASGLTVTVANGPRVLEAIARTRLWRMLGLLASAVAMLVVLLPRIARDGRLDVTLLIVLWLLLGYFAGAVVAELLTARSAPAPGTRSASLRRREATDYVGGWAVRWPRVLAAVGLVAGCAALVAGNRSWWVPAAGAGAALIWAVTALVTRYVVERPQELDVDDMLTADEAIRSRSLHALAGAAVGIEVWLASLALAGLVLTVAVGLGDDVARPLSSLALVIFALAVPLAGVVAGRRLARRPFRVRRTELMPR